MTISRMLANLTPEEQDLVGELWKSGGAIPKRHWVTGRKKGGKVEYKALPFLADIYKYDPDYGCNSIPKIMWDKMRKNPGPWVYISWSDHQWSEIDAWFKELQKRIEERVTNALENSKSVPWPKETTFESIPVNLPDPFTYFTLSTREKK